MRKRLRRGGSAPHPIPDVEEAFRETALHRDNDHLRYALRYLQEQRDARGRGLDSIVGATVSFATGIPATVIASTVPPPWITLHLRDYAFPSVALLCDALGIVCLIGYLRAWHKHIGPFERPAVDALAIKAIETICSDGSVSGGHLWPEEINQLRQLVRRTQRFDPAVMAILNSPPREEALPDL